VERLEAASTAPNAIFIEWPARSILVVGHAARAGAPSPNSAARRSIHVRSLQRRFAQLACRWSENQQHRIQLERRIRRVQRVWANGTRNAELHIVVRGARGRDWG